MEFHNAIQELFTGSVLPTMCLVCGPANICCRKQLEVYDI